MRNAVWMGTQYGDLTYDGYTVVLPYYANANNTIAMIEEIAQIYNIDVENIEMDAFSRAAAYSIGLAYAINTSDSKIHVSTLNYISGGGARRKFKRTCSRSKYNN